MENSKNELINPKDLDKEHEPKLVKAPRTEIIYIGIPRDKIDDLQTIRKWETKIILILKCFGNAEIHSYGFSIDSMVRIIFNLSKKSILLIRKLSTTTERIVIYHFIILQLVKQKWR